MSAFEKFIDAAMFKGLAVQEKGDTAMVQCPAHDDGRPSLSVKKIEGQVLLYCMAGCSTADVVDALGLSMNDLFDDEKGFTYEYPGGRRVHRTPDKQFYQQGNKADTSLYRADRIVGAGPIYLVEGEKDALATEAAGGQAVSPPNGANAKPERYDWEPLRGKIVHVVADRDEPGRKRAQELVEHLEGVAMSVSLYEPLVGKDMADHVAAGHTLSELKCLSQPDILSMSEAFDAWRKWRDSEHARPIPTPWHSINKTISGGLQPGRLYVVGARTGSGKSVAGVNMVAYAAEHGHTGLVVSVEMPHVEITSRILAAQAYVDYASITKRDFGEYSTKIDRYIADHRSLPLYICDKATISMEEIAAKTRMLKDSKGLEVLFIDYAQLIKPSNRSVSRQEQVSHIARTAKLIAMEMSLPVILAAQLNRKTAEEQRAPRMEDLRESGELEQSADVIMLLHRDEATSNIYVNIPKNRTGKAGTVVLKERFDQARVDVG